MTFTAYALLTAVLVPAQGAVLTGKLGEKPTHDGRMIFGDFTPSARIDIPGYATGDKVLTFRATSFKSAAAPNGFEVVLLQRGEVVHLFADRDMDGKITEKDRVAEMRDTTNVTSWDHEWNLPVGADGPVLPVKSRITVSHPGPNASWSFLFTPSYRVEGHVEIDGRKTLVSLPFKLATGNIDVNNGYIGIDTDGDGKIASGALSPEYVSADGKPVVMRIGSRYVSIESADFKAHTFTMKERTASEYTLIEVRVGSPIEDFTFTDFDGKSRKLSEFRGKHVLLDFWGSWCKPCVEDVPAMKDAYERFRGRGFEIVGLDFEHGQSADKVRPFLKEKDVRWVNGTPESVRELVEDRFRVSAFPTLILLDPDGKVLETSSAPLRGKKLIETLEKIFEKK
jgi:thiol-disulfide isomerase/thioredoxin